MNSQATHVNASQHGSLPGELGFEWMQIGRDRVTGRVEIASKHFSPHGYLHGATIVALADSACGFGCLASLPANAQGFVTAELKTNFVGTIHDGFMRCDAKLVHAGRTTQVWDAEIQDEATGKSIALFRCTQMLLYAKAGDTSSAAVSPAWTESGNP